jgi:thiamine pyrophosphate-dependent acetolactate synthase large subunit-like protein
VLIDASHPLLIAGSGVVQAGATRVLGELVALLPHARVVTTPRALGAFPASHAQSIQSLGFGGSVDAELDEADLLLVLGSRLHEMSTNFDERLYKKKILQLDLDPAAIGVAFPAEGYRAELCLALAEIASAVLDEPRALRSSASPA